MLFLLIVWMAAGSGLAVSAQETRLTYEQLESRLSSIEDPFQSQLPKKEKEPELELIPPSDVPKPSDLPKKEPEPLPKKIDLPKPITLDEKLKPLPNNLTVDGIIWDTDRPQAIINGKIVDIGDTVSEIKITNIQKSNINGLFYGKPVTIQRKGVDYDEQNDVDNSFNRADFTSIGGGPVLRP